MMIIVKMVAFVVLVKVVSHIMNSIETQVNIDTKPEMNWN